MSAEVIRIVYTVEDVLDIAEENDIDPDLAVERALEWGKHIEATASSLAGQQLEDCITIGTP